MDQETMQARPQAAQPRPPQARKLSEAEILRIKVMELKQRVADLLIERARLVADAAELEARQIAQDVRDEAARLGLPPRFRVVDGSVAVDETGGGE